MDRKYVSALLTVILGIGIIAFFMGIVYRGDNYRQIAGAVIMFFEMIILFVTGII